MACNITTIQTEACENEFMQAAQNEVLYRALVLKLLCNGITVPGSDVILGEGGIPILGEGGIPILSGTPE